MKPHIKVLRLILAIVGIAYLAAFLLASLHFHKSATLAVRNGNPQVLLLPVAAVGILRAYAQFVVNRTWPFASKSEVVSLDKLIASEGVVVHVDYPVLSLRFTFPPRNKPEYRVGRSYALTYENYGLTTFGDPPGAYGGQLLRIGRYFCLMAPGNEVLYRLTGASECFEIVFRSGGQYHWRKLGDRTEQSVRLERVK